MKDLTHRRRRALRLGTLLGCFVALTLGLAVLTTVADLDLISRASGADGAKGNGDSFNSAISADGRFVAFDSVASNLNPADQDATDDVFMRDLQANTTTLVSRVSGAAGVKGNDTSSNPAISADGRLVVFESNSSNLDPADQDSIPDVFVRDLQVNTTTLVSRASGINGGKGDGPSVNAAISADGRFVAFDSVASNLDPADGDTSGNVFVRDLQTNMTTLVSRASPPRAPKGTAFRSLPRLRPKDASSPSTPLRRTSTPTTAT
jgi:Tol biopolymer transport system component